MSVAALQKSINNLTARYKKYLDLVSEDDFQRTPPHGGWSYSEVYSHIFQSNLASLIAMEKCILQTGIKSDARIHWKVWLLFFLGKFPPGKIKAPEKIEAMVKKITREEARNMIIKFSHRFDQIAPNVRKAPENCKVKHPRLGLLTAGQWLKFIKIHSEHHVRQLERILKDLSGS